MLAAVLSIVAHAQQSNAPSALESCVLSGDIACIQQQLDNGADVNQLTSFGVSPLRIAIGHNYSDIALLLLAHHANPNVTGTEDYSNNVDNNNSLLLLAVSERDVALTKALLDAGADPNATNKLGGTALIAVLTDVNPKSNTIFDLLLAAKADPNLIDIDGDTPFSLAVGVALAPQDTDPIYKQRIKQMLAIGANPNLGNTQGNVGVPIARAADGKQGDKDLLALLLANGADPNLRDPLVLDNINARRDLAELLIDNGLEVDLRSKIGASALNLAVDRDDLPQARLLLSLGAAAESRHEIGTTLSLAVQKNDVEMVRLLLDHGASPKSLVAPQQKLLSQSDFPNPDIRKLLQDRLTLEDDALEIIHRYPGDDAAMMKLIQDHTISPVDAEKITAYAAAAPADPGLLALSILFSFGSGKNQPVPPEALQHEEAGVAAYSAATSRTQFLSAANEFVQAARLAPWMPAYPRNACLLLMMGGAYSRAEPLCYAYKTVVPGDAAFDLLLQPYMQKANRL